jgi:hypothetical protein
MWLMMLLSLNKLYATCLLRNVAFTLKLMQPQGAHRMLKLIHVEAEAAAKRSLSLTAEH